MTGEALEKALFFVLTVQELREFLIIEMNNAAFDHFRGHELIVSTVQRWLMRPE